MRGCEGEIEGQTPVTKHSEVAKGLPVCYRVTTGTVDADLGEDGRKRVERDECADKEQHGWRQNP